MIASCDLETACGQKTCPGYDQANSSLCDHAVHPKLNKIKIIGVYDGENYFNFLDDVAAFDAYSHSHRAQYIFHNGKFDYKVLKAKGSRLSLRNYVGDTQLLGACIFNKIPDGWLKMYNEKRSELNAFLPPKQRHRVGTPLSLKTMAPFYLGIDTFWENPTDHDDEEYNKKDCVYTLQLHAKLLHVAELDGTDKFYETYLMQWQKLLCEAECEGLLIDTKLLYQMYGDAIKARDILEGEVHEKITEGYKAYKAARAKEIFEEAETKCELYISQRLKNKDKSDGVRQRYITGAVKKYDNLPERFNLSSPKQMLSILTWAGIDTLVEKRDKETNEWIEKEGTDKFILKRSKVGGNEFATALLKYREKETEVRYLKQYIECLVGDRIYGGFNIVGTRTGRLSSAGPNLQNIKGSLRLPFIIADPDKYSIYTVDSSQIEPRVIAYLTQDKPMVELFVQGRDFHNFATKLFFPHETQGVAESDIKKDHSPLRKTAKTGDLSCLYGTGKYTFQTMLLVREEMSLSLEECDALIKKFKGSMESVIKWKQNLEGSYNNGTRIYDNFGFPIQAGTSVYMTLFNGMVQGQASRMIFHASLMAYKHVKKNGIDAMPLAWVHDEVIWRFPKGKEEECRKVVDHYMTCYKLDTPHGRVPLDVEGHIADRWEK